MMNSLILECEGIIYSIASKYKNTYNVEDLYQVGCIGVIKAYKNFKGNLNVKFTTYAYNYILGEIIDYIRKDRNIKVSNDYYNLYKRYQKSKDLLTNKLCREPLFSEISEFMEVPENVLLNVIQTTAFTKSYENAYNNYECSSEAYSLSDKLMLDEALNNIEEPGKSIIKYRYFYGLSQKETAEAMNMSQSKVSREEVYTLKKLNKIVS